jgi:CRISPR type IV-associated protein Csf2
MLSSREPTNPKSKFNLLPHHHIIMSKYRIDTTFTLTSPLHISEPGTNYWNPETFRWASSNAGGGIPCTRTKNMPLATIAEAGDEGEKVFNRSLPYIPGNSLRGMLRRAAAEDLFEALKARGEKIDLDLYHVMLCGAVSASPEKAATITEALESGKNPFASLFGGGPKFLWSRLSVGNAFAITPETLKAGLVPERLAAESAAARRVSAVVIETKVDDIMRGQRSVPSVIENAEQEIQKWIALLDDSRAKKNSGEDSKKVGIAGIHSKEVVIPGTRLHAEHILDTSFAGEATLGGFIAALVRVANDQRLGGGARAGCGRFVLNASARNGDGGAFPLLMAADGKYQPNLGSKVVAAAVSEWQSFTQNVTAAQLAQVFSIDKNAA